MASSPKRSGDCHDHPLDVADHGQSGHPDRSAPEHVADGRTVPSLVQSDGVDEKLEQLIQVKSGLGKPENAFTAVKYYDHWFWIDKRDFRSKRTFGFLMIIFSLMETGGKEGLPLVTIPAG